MSVEMVVGEVNQAILAGELERINDAALTAQRMAENLNIVDTLYKKYGEKIGIANKLMNLINNQYVYFVYLF